MNDDRQKLEAPSEDGAGGTAALPPSLVKSLMAARAALYRIVVEGSTDAPRIRAHEASALLTYMEAFERGELRQ